jgi:hypothetical protein
MARNTGRTVYLRNDGLWANKANDTLHASGTYASKEDAVGEARKALQAVGGGDLTIKDDKGAVLSRERIAPPD